MSNTVKAILLGVIAIGFLLNRLARARPEIAWLQVFRLPVVKMSEAERERRRRRANRMGALEIILAGLALPAVYLISTIMFFSDPSTIGIVIVSACAIFCIAVGIWIFARNV